MRLNAIKKVEYSIIARFKLYGAWVGEFGGRTRLKKIVEVVNSNLHLE